jgi:general secretion pathway protein L
MAQQRLMLQHQGEELALSLIAPTAAGQAAGQVQRLEEFGRLPWEASATEAAGEDPLARLLAPRINPLPRWLLLPAGSGLRRRLTLPAAAADRLRDVLGFEIDRQTPFAANEVYFDARLLGRRGDGQIDAELVVVPRATLDAALQALGAPLRATLAGVDIAGAEAYSGFADVTPEPTALGVNLLPDAQRRHRRDPMILWNLGLALVAVVALAAGLWQILNNRTAAADALETQANQRVQQARRVSEQKKQLIDLVEGMRFLQTTRSGRPTTVEVLDELSRRLPDNTYVEKVSVEGDRLMVIGLSSEASRLVERLQSSKLWRSMTLTGALQPDPRTGKDRFTLTAELAVVKPADDKGGANARRNP